MNAISTSPDKHQPVTEVQIQTLNFSRRRILAASATLAASAMLPGAAQAAMRNFTPRGSASVDHTAFDRMLQSYVVPDGQGYNAVNYRRLKSEAQDALRGYLAGLLAVSPSALSGADAHAYWINLYNAKTLEVVLEYYPVSSIREINLGGGGLFGRGPWSRKLISVEGTELSLDNIEHDIVRPLFGDPLSHYGLNCASYSCPNLATRAYTGANVDALLAQGAAEYINHPRGVAVSKGSITASKIYSWYADDFGGRRGLKPHWLGYARPDHARKIESASIGGYGYDWRLNEV